MRLLAVGLVLGLVVVACGGDAAQTTALTTTQPVTTQTDAAASAAPSGGAVDSDGDAIPPAPPVPDGPLDAAVIADLDTVFGDLEAGVDLGALEALGTSGDARVSWLLADLLRFIQSGTIAEVAVASFERLTDTEVTGFAWGTVTDWLIAWDTPAPPGYVGWKRILFEAIEPGWAPFFDDADADIDWRFVSWGGVRMDDRPISRVDEECAGCIPALDDPGLTDAAGGSWYPDERVVFGVVVDGEARAYPKHIMEIHEMVNDTIARRRVGIPYCTLCGSAQAYFTDEVPDGFETLELRTSGLLSRSNKVMFDLHTESVFDTFRGIGLSGPLQGHQLEMITVFTSTWGDWKEAHPNTTIIAEDGGIGRSYAFDPLGGRDDDGPIFPVGDVDPRLPVQEQVLGVTAPDGTTVAFPAEAARRALESGDEVTLAGITVHTDGAALSASFDGAPLATHQAFWFAWSQFNPGTLVWNPLTGS